ncbi:hypothetical protein ABH922_004821 [Rhodococcus sp. 27YEA15]|uniref:hypothetical protein n=1 Tax=Rhodococcus sp. 27YEA15 TaxID=3156259 RepID=UPI003C7ADADF
MGTFKADVQELKRLGGVLQSLGQEAAGVRVGPAAGPYLSGPGGMLSSVLEASSISGDLIEGTLVPGLQERLSETGEVMIHLAHQFRDRDEQSAAEMARAFTEASGDWNPGEPIR